MLNLVVNQHLDVGYSTEQFLFQFFKKYIATVFYYSKCWLFHVQKINDILYLTYRDNI